MSGDLGAPAINALRERGLGSLRNACGVGVCGSCTILLNGAPASSCLTPLVALHQTEVQTAECLAPAGELSLLQQRFIDLQAFQCSYCTPGFLLAATALLNETNGELDRQTVVDALEGNLCRCGCYPSILDAVLDVSRLRQAPLATDC